MPREFKGLATALFISPGRRISVWARLLQNKYELLLHAFLFPFFCFVKVISVPSHKSQAPCKASFMTINRYWQGAFWLFGCAGEACMTSCWTFLDVASQNRLGYCTWMAWQLARSTLLRSVSDRYKNFLFTRKTFDKSILTTKQTSKTERPPGLFFSDAFKGLNQTITQSQSVMWATSSCGR